MKKNNQIILAIIVIIGLIAIMFTPVGTSIKKMIEGEDHVVGVRDEKLTESDFDIDLIGHNGATDTNLLDFKKSGEVVFINYWGSWCPPCVQEMPSIQQLFEAKGQKVKFVLVAIQDKPKTFNAFLQKNNYTMPVYEPNSPISVNMLPHVFPTTYILNKKGEIVLKETKTRDWNDAEINKLIDQLIAE